MKYLFQKIKIGKLELDNRVVLPALNMCYATKEGFIDGKTINFWVERAKGGAGLMIIGGCYVEPLGISRYGSTAIYDEKFIPKLKELTSQVHKYNSKIACQLYHAGRHANVALVSSLQPVSASAIPSRLRKTVPRELTTAEAEAIVAKFGEAAKRAKAAGFDAIEFHAASGYLISQFLSPVTNKRSDKYGGDLRQRMTFLVEIIKEVRNAVGEDFPLLCRISGDEFVEGGNTIKESKIIAEELERLGINAIDVTGGWHESEIPEITMSVPQGAFVYLAQEIKSVVNIPVIASIRMTDPAFADKVVEEEKADLVAIGRALIADPEWPQKACNGRYEEIRKCIACCQGCVEMIWEGNPATCLLNVQVGREEELRIVPALRKKKVIVIGGGPAGLEAARVSAMRGHEVILYERTNKLGGQLNLASVVPSKKEFAETVQYFSKQLDFLHVKVVLGAEAKVETIMKQKPDTVILATGAKLLIPQISGIGLPHVVKAWDVLSGDAETGHKIVIIGGGPIGCETGLFLAKKGTIDCETAFFLASVGAIEWETAVKLNRKGNKSITIIEMLDKVAKALPRFSRRELIRNLLSADIKILTNAVLKEISDKGVYVIQSGQPQFIEADTIVITVGVQSDNDLMKELKGQVEDMFVVGDCKEPRNALEAIHEGFMAGIQA